MQEVGTIRPSNVSITPLFRSTVAETPVSLYRMKITSQSADARRASFVWRAPSSKLLLNPLVYYSAQFTVTVPSKFSKVYNMASVQQAIDTGGGAAIDVQNAYAVGAVDAATGERLAKSDGICITLGEGNCVMNACESIQYSINGMSMSHQNFHLFKRSLDRTNIPADTAQRCFSRCGGAWNRYDERCTSSSLSQRGALSSVDGTVSAAGFSGCVQAAGMTCDSGTAQRARNFADIIVAKAGATAEGGGYDDGIEFTINVLAPLDGGLFNQVYGEAGLSATGVYPKLCLAIPNANSMAVTILWKDLEKQLVRRLGRCFGLSGQAAGGNVQAQTESLASPFKVAFKGTEAHLHVKYLRMQAFRSYPEAVSLACYRMQTYIQDMTLTQDVIKNDSGIVVAGGAVQKYCDGFSGPYLLASGPDIKATGQTQAIGSAYGYAEDKALWVCSFQNCVFSQPPSTLFFVAQKSMDCTQHRSPDSRVKCVGADALTGAGHVAALTPTVYANVAVADIGRKVMANYRNVIQNQDSNLAIVRFKLLVQSSLASWELTSENFPFLLDVQQLWDVHKKNCHSQYLKDAGVDEWNRRACSLKLSCADYLAGLGASFGSAFPITISCDVTFQNRSAFVTGLKYSDVRSPGPILFQEPIHARAVMVGIFDRQIAQISTASAVLSAQNYTATTVQSLLQRRT